MYNKNQKRPNFLSIQEHDDLNKLDVENIIGKNSKQKYKCGVNRFLRYCEERNISPIPTSKTLSHFVSEVSREIQPSSVSLYLTGISYHFSQSYPEVHANRISTAVRDTVKGCKKSFSTPTKRANAMLLSDIDIAADFFKVSFDDLLFNTIMGMGFNGLHCLGVLVEPDNENLRNDRRLIKSWSLEIAENEEYASYALPCSKTDSGFSGTTVIIP